jgi:hypothetical protein
MHENACSEKKVELLQKKRKEIKMEDARRPSSTPGDVHEGK